jgi:type VI secretion system protein ImpD
MLILDNFYLFFGGCMSNNCEHMIARLISLLDQKISKQLSVIMQHERFKKLESLWRGFHQLIVTDYSKSRVKIKLLDISWQEISKDLNLSYDIKYTNLYYKIYSRELNTAGGLPFGLLVVDHHLKMDNQYDLKDLHDFDDIYTAELLGALGEACLCHVICGLDEYFFGDNPDTILHDSAKIYRILESDDYISWQNLRRSKTSRFLNIVLPDYLIRPLYKNYPASFIFSEKISNSKEGLWGNAVFLLAMNVIREFSRICWFGFLRAYDEKGENGAIVELPSKLRVIPKINFSVESDPLWADLGLTVLTSIYLSDIYGFHSNSSIHLSDRDVESSKVIDMMQTNLMCCRFSHYLKVLLRDKVGNYDTPEECKTFLSMWMNKYVMNSSLLDESLVARYPLKSYEIDVFAQKDDPTIYDCKVRIEPQYQYDLSTVSILLTAQVNNIKSNKQSS